MSGRGGYCRHCGARFEKELELVFPKSCKTCKITTYNNPLPVCVSVQPVVRKGQSDWWSLLMVRRGIQPGLGQIALPGGYLEVPETWQQGMVRELREEAMIHHSPDEVELFGNLSEGPHIVIFGLLPPVTEHVALENFVPHREVEELVIVDHYTESVFSLHTETIRKFFDIVHGQTTWPNGRAFPQSKV